MNSIHCSLTHRCLPFSGIHFHLWGNRENAERVNLTAINDNSSDTCLNLNPIVSQDGSILFRADVSPAESLVAVSINSSGVNFDLGQCHLGSPALVLMYGSIGNRPSCRPFCHPMVVCRLQHVVEKRSLFYCDCRDSDCNFLAIQIYSSSLMTSRAEICMIMYDD